MSLHVLMLWCGSGWGGSMTEWRQTTLDQLVKLQRGHDLPTSQRKVGNVPVVGAAGPSGTHDTAMVKAPGVVLGRAGASMGKATYCDVDFWPLNTSLYVTDFLGNDPRFTYYLLDLIDFSGYNSGAAQPMLNRNYITKIKISLPEPSEQEAVASVVGALEDKISINERIAVSAAELAAVHYLATREREPVKITDIANVTMGQSPPGDTFNEQRTGIPFYQGTRDFGFRFPGYRVWCTAVTRQAEANDVLVSVRAPVGQINVAAELCGIGRGLASVRSEKYPHVLLQALSADRSIWLPYEAEGTVFGSINKKQLTQLEIGWPAAEFVDSLESRLSALDQRIRHATEESRSLAALRDTLLPQLMSGKLRVREAEKIVEDAV
ncbi:restriction endonuclease subunit S [Streptomyces tendae]|uniref:restriction endonuclease subunit S n=1 Tax=Streptomyces tendae TaxID=1932 RepID=UPI00366798E0